MYSGPREVGGGGGYDDEKPGGRQELAQRGPVPQAPEMKASGFHFHLALSMLMFTSRWGLLLNQKNKISCELTTSVKGECLGQGWALGEPGRRVKRATLARPLSVSAR